MINENPYFILNLNYTRHIFTIFSFLLYHDSNAANLFIQNKKKSMR